MAAFPDVKFDWRDLGEDPQSVVERTEMERGIPKQRRVNSDARVEVPITVYFDSKAEVTDFEDWFYVDINAGQDWFDIPHPRTGVVVQARVVGGKLGPLSYLNRTLEKSKRSLTIEYWRSAW